MMCSTQSENRLSFRSASWSGWRCRGQVADRNVVIRALRLFMFAMVSFLANQAVIYVYVSFLVSQTLPIFPRAPFRPMYTLRTLHFTDAEQL